MKCIDNHIRHFKTAVLFQAAFVLATIMFFANNARSAGRFVGQENAARVGLTRAWLTQVQVDGSRSHFERAVLNGDRLTVLTSAGVVQELNALTGQTYWVSPLGNGNYPSLGPSGNDKYVALLNGSTLYVLDRADGKSVIVRRVGGAPGAAPAVTDKTVFVPLLNGRIEGYPLGKQTLTPWYYQSFGRATVAPLATAESVVWSTDAGYLYVGNSSELKMRFRLETGADIVAPPAYRKPYVYVASMSGELFAMNELSGDQHWKYATGFPIMRAPAAVGERVFITSEEPALHCVDAKNGNVLWEAPHVVQFAAASKDRVYAMNDLGAFVVLDAKTGATLAQVAIDRPIRALVNDQTDRVYLCSADGMVECLHEVGATQPLYHNSKPAEPEKKAAPVEKRVAPMTKPAAAPAEGTEKAQPKAKAAAPPEKSGGEEKKPAKKSDFGVDENPFGN